MTENTSTDGAYVLQRAPEETRRLQAQARILNPATQRMLTQAGIAKGMLVLDVGSGAGDVALLLAEQVGPGGSVVGVELNPELLDIARKRVQAVGYTNVTFLQGDITSMSFDMPFDAIIGRLILMHLQSPASILRRLADFLQPGGILAFQEIDLAHFATHPVYPANSLNEQVFKWQAEAFSRAGIPLRMGLEMYRAFLDAGLPAPFMQGEATPIMGEDWAGYDWGAETTRSLLPIILKFGLASEEEVDIDTLAERMRAESLSQRLVLRGPDVFSAWTCRASSGDV